MASFNYSTMQMTAKIVYYGPGLGGKTTNLQRIYDRTKPAARGEMVSLETHTDRTLFFDLLPLEVGTIAGFRTRIQLYTVPGQVFYNTTRKLVLKGADGIVFVADSQRSMQDANIESLRNLEANLAELGILFDTVPFYLQYNKRDLSDILPVEELNRTINHRDWAFGEASALNGDGVFETLRSISKAVLISLKKQLEAPRPPRATAPPAARAGVGDNGRFEVRRDLQVSLKKPDLERASAVSLDLKVEGPDNKIVHSIRDFRMPLAPGSGIEEVLLRLQIALDSED